MINLLDNNEDGNLICPKCHSDNVKIYEIYLETSLKGNRNYRGLYEYNHKCLDCGDTNLGKGERDIHNTEKVS